MCGIAGAINRRGDSLDPNRLALMSNALSHRGPDDNGIMVLRGAALVHQRLSILDLSAAGHQPFSLENGKLSMVFNGEIYNYKELKKDLMAKGIRFRTETDTEVLLKLFELEGETCLEKLNGMFAFAIWDTEKEVLFIARDRVGVKPLYYTISDNEFAFASEQKALFAYGIDHQLNARALDELLIYRYIAGESTLFKEVRKLLPGHFAYLHKEGELVIKRWYHLGEKIKNHPEIAHPKAWFTETFQSSINYRMVSDRKVGVLLSAGLDSSSVAQSLKNSGFADIETFNVGFKDPRHDESSLAAKFCDHLGYSFNSICVEADDLFGKIIDASYFHDEPLIHFNDPQILAISQLARSKVSVLLSGEGADEILGGYVRYKVFQHRSYWPLLRIGLHGLNKISSSERNLKLEKFLKLKNIDLMLLSSGNNMFPYDFVDAYKLFGISMLPEYRIKVLEEAKEVYPGNPLRQLLYLDQHTYLQSLNDRNDRATMGAGIECREPFMDYRIMEGVGKLGDSYLFKGKKNKEILMQTIGSQLPDYIRNFRKIGFSVPWTHYFLNHPVFSSYLKEMHHSEVFKHGILRKLNIELLVREFTQKQAHKSLITQLFFYAIWYDTYFKKVQSVKLPEA